LPETDQHIKRLNEKLQQLLKRFQQLQKDNERQSKRIALLEEEKAKNAEQVMQLQQQVTILKAATGQLSEPDKKEFEKTISRYIREIDKCISLLSN
jgi:CHASE3 domain sensor protein